MSRKIPWKAIAAAMLAYLLVSCRGGGGAPGLRFALAGLINAIVG
ncbi:MAG: hypothetical protein ACREJQ_04090 [bacterium]